MPGPVLPRSAVDIPGVPHWLSLALQNLALGPASTAIDAEGPAVLKAGGKALADRLGEILAPTTKGTAIPRIRLTSVNPAKNVVNFHGVDSGEPFDATVQQLQSLFKSGALAPEPGPYEGASVPTLVRKLLLQLPK
jgi:hypothetical protein